MHGAPAPFYQTLNMAKNHNIQSVSYGRTINMGNYESVRIDLTATVTSGEDYRDTLNDLKTEMLKLEKQTRREGM